MSAKELPKDHGAGHLLQLDGLRALAVMAVIVQHTITLPTQLNLGRAGVRLFFVLSGFLITRILLQARARCTDTNDARYSLRAFYGRRFLRIFPLYYLVLAAALFLDLPRIGDYFWSLVSYTSNLQAAASGNFQEQPFGHFWSLAVEEQFYIFWPTLMLFLPARWLLPAIVATIVAGPLSRLVLLACGRGVAYEVMTTSCLDTLGAGALLAYLKDHARVLAAAYRRIGTAALCAGLALLTVIATPALIAQAYMPAKVLLDMVYLLIFAWLVSRAADGFTGSLGRFLECRPLVYFGMISYGVYVYHYFVPVITERIGEGLGVGVSLPRSGPVLCAYVTLVTLGLATVSWFLFEKPLNELKQYLPYQRKRVVVVQVPAAGVRPARAGVAPELAVEAPSADVPAREAA